MKKLQDKRKKPHLLIDSTPSDMGRLLKSGFLAILFHIAFIIFVILNLKSAIPKSSSNVYWVTVRSGSSVPLPLLGKAQMHKERSESIPEGRKRGIVLNKENQEQPIPLPPQPVIISVPQEEQKQLLHHEKEEEEVVEPIPLPMAEVSPLSTDVDKKTDEDSPILLRSSSLEEEYMNTVSNEGSGERPRMGPAGVGEGTGLGQGESVWGLGYGSGSGRGELGRGGSGDGLGPGGEGSGKVAGVGQGGSGWGSENGSRPGQGGSGMGGSGKGRAGDPYPRYAKNPKPVYPLEAREKGYEGEVLLKVEVLSNGQVGQVEVKRSSGYEMLDESALTTVKQWKFIPARRGEVAIPVWVNIPIKFQLL
jgi:TonB family protein